MSRPAPAARMLLALVVAVFVVALLFLVVFPWVDRTFITDPTLEALGPPADVLA